MNGGIISWGYIKGSVQIRRTSFHPHEHEASVQINLNGVKKKKKTGGEHLKALCFLQTDDSKRLHLDYNYFCLLVIREIKLAQHLISFEIL